MLDFSHLPTSTKADVQVFNGTAPTSGGGWQTWVKPRGASMLHILCIGAGGNGGNGAVGAASTAAGGGGGGSGVQNALVIPAALLPETLYCSIAQGAGAITYLMIEPVTANTSSCILRAGAGGNGGNAAGATAGAAGAAGTVSAISAQPLAGLGFYTLLAGQAGIVGSATGNGAALTLPTTGLLITGGTGGGGLPASGTGNFGGSFTVAGTFPPHSGGVSAGATTNPAGNGSNGFDRVINGLSYSYGGTGGGTTHAAATGAGLVAGNGGAGGIGCGGGGGGGGFTGSTQGLGGRGGPGQIIITAW